MAMCGTNDFRIKLSGSPGFVAASVSTNDCVKAAPRVDPEKGRGAGDPLPTGDMDLEPGGVRVDAYRLAAVGLDRGRYGRLASELVMLSCLLGSLMEDAAIGGECMDSAAESSSIDCMKATTMGSKG